MFSRDCPEFDVLLPGGKRLVVLPNHFKSKRNGDDQESQDRRKAQADRVHAIAVAALARLPFVVLGGNLNDIPTSAPLASLFTEGFLDIQQHGDYPTTQPGTYATGLASAKIDYLISSPQLWAKVHACGIERRGSYHPTLWPAFDTVTKASEEASDPHCVWMEVAI